VTLATVGASNGVGCLLHFLVQLVQQVAQLAVGCLLQMGARQLGIIQLPFALQFQNKNAFLMKNFILSL
jgi:hypothetical protein